MSGNDAREIARRKSRYGHRDWIVWCDKSGEWWADLATAGSVKRALLDVGTQGRFVRYAQNTAHAHSMTWRLGINFMQHLRYYERYGKI